ncbi:MAG: hypothetical protein IKD45_01600 [Clostridia bacterium]|nr:hypothetical protein [Clostridia bacterium]
MQNGDNKNNSGTADMLGFLYRKYFGALLTVILTAVCLYFVFYFFAGDIAAAQCKLDRLSATDKNEAVFADTPMGNESFINFNGSLYIGSGDKRVNCDLLMLRTEGKYENNPFGFGGTLAADECAVSNNLLYSYGLSLGDTVSVKGTKSSFRIAAALPACSGIDDKYNHEGIVILGNDTSLTSNYSFSYLSFVTNGDSYMGLDKIIFLVRIKDGARSALTSAFLLMLLFTALTAVLWELLIGRKKYADFTLYASYGMRTGSLFVKVLLSVLARYFLPTVLVMLLWLSRLSYYGSSYIVPMLIYITVCALLSVILALIIHGRVRLCRMKRR